MRAKSSTTHLKKLRATTKPNKTYRGVKGRRRGGCGCSGK
ncbi:hypothetical protein GCM10008935_06350 [Alkalibacillus silvisoli]|uniref:50S ribosomal protein L15 n=1 Tax=Alkalibacillus silvisoli TaxID=392823 RepID=A0ABP3JHY7_9BACI